jgi:peptide/nickel transport system substrate-binding protein
MRRLFPRYVTLTAALAAAGLLAAACSSSTSSNGGGNNTASGASSGSTLTISDESGGTWACDFNPFLSSDTWFGSGPVYEPLMFVNNLAPQPLAPSAIKPWLATSYTWNPTYTQLTFTIRPSVKWSDGTPMTAADVAFTFNMLKAHHSMDLESVWSNVGGPLTAVTASGNQVVMTLNKPSPLYFYNIADQVPIVPQHIWSKIANPTTYNDKNPIGTGAYTMHSCTPANIQYKANPNYYQAGLPKIKTVNFPSYLTNPPANADLASGADQWGSQYIPDIQAAYLAKSPDYHTFSPPVASVSIVINLGLGKSSPLSNPLVRQAMAYAINRPKAAQIGEGGQEPPSNQTDIITAADKGPYAPSYDASQAAAYGNAYAYNPAKAEALLKQAGYTKVVGGVRENSAGQKLSFALTNNGGYSDWVATLQDVVIPELAAVGIQVHLNDLSQTSYESALYTGKYQLGYFAQTGGPGAFYEMRQWLFSGNTAPIGQVASTNYERYSNKNTDALINEYAATPPTDTAKLAGILNQLQLVMLKTVPIIPVTGQVDWYQWDTAHITGWPTPPNWYAQPAQYAYPDWGIVLLHLAPKG